MSCLPRIEFDYPQNSTPDAAIIWLHGLGADGSDFAGIVPQLKLPGALAIRFIFPHAPSIPVTINNGMVMPAWYDIVELDIGRRVDDVQLVASAAAVHKLIDEQVAAGIMAERIIVGGFSQGGAVAIQAALTYPQRLAGLMSLSSYFATEEIIEPHPASVGLPVLVCHGTHDPVVAQARGKRASDLLSGLGYQVEYRTYMMEHSVCLEEVADISRWFQRVLA